jgi:hypothetical protein
MARRLMETQTKPQSTGHKAFPTRKPEEILKTFPVKPPNKKLKSLNQIPADELRKLSAKELKLLLTTACVKLPGTFDRESLLDLAIAHAPQTASLKAPPKEASAKSEKKKEGPRLSELTMSQLRKCSAKELKALLIKAKVSPDGCFDKETLLERASSRAAPEPLRPGDIYGPAIVPPQDRKREAPAPDEMPQPKAQRPAAHGPRHSAII